MRHSKNSYVEHPRFGLAPRYTGLDADMTSTAVRLHYRLRRYTRPMLQAFHRMSFSVPLPDMSTPRIIEGTAIVADVNKQTGSAVPITHYYDEEHACRDCGRLYLFYAEDQRYWYEELQFHPDTYSVRCYPCQQKYKKLKATKHRYEELVHSKEPTPEIELALALARLDLVEARVFHHRQLEQVRAFLNSRPDHEQAQEIRIRLKALEARSSLFFI